MHRTIGYLSKRFVHLQPGEGRKVLLTFLYFYLVISAYYVIKPVSRALVLDELGSRLVPYADLICAICMGPVVTLFARMVDRVSKPRLVTVSFWGVAAILVGFWKLLALPQPWIAGAFYVWVSILSVLVVTLFWLVANDLYRARDAKRLFGFIGSGGILGGITGSSVAALGAQLIGTPQLLLLSAGLLVGSWLVVGRLWRFAPERAPQRGESLAAAKRDTFLSDVKGFVRLITRSRYLLLLVAIVGINKIASSLVFYQFNPFIEQAFPGVDAKTAFNGFFFGAINVLAFVVQFFCTSWILRRFGLLWALLALPSLLLFGSAALLAVPIFWIAAGTELCDRSLNYSLDNTAKEVLYLPIDRSIRYKVKPFIDMVVFRFGKGLAAILGIVLLDVAGMPARYLSLLTVPLLGVWVLAVIRVRREYIATIRTMLQARSAARQQASQEPTGSFGWLIARRSSEHKFSLMSKVISEDHRAASEHAQQLLEQLARYDGPGEARSAFEQRLEMSWLRQIIQDRTKPLSLRRQAIEVIPRLNGPEAVDYLCGLVVVEEDAAMRHEVIRELVKLRLARGPLPIPVGLFRRQVAREVADYQRICHVAAVYSQHAAAMPAGDDPVIGLLQALMEESLEQIFRLLMLLYRPEDIHLVYEQLQAPDVHLRADAIELLDNLVDPVMRATIFPILDEHRFFARMGQEDGSTLREPTIVYRVLQEAIWDHNCWLSITTLCAVGRMRLTTMREELERASRHTEPVISVAAKFALHLSDLP